ncbi:MAG: TonB-dependent receptor [Longimicrobiales bacterium]
MRPLSHSLALLALLALAIGAADLAAQGRVQIQGTVVEEASGDPIPAVDIVARAPDGRYLLSTMTDDSGHFEVEVQYTDGVQLFASRIGYMKNKTPVLRFDEHTYFEVELRLSPDAVLLAPLKVVSRGVEERSGVLSGYRSRVGTGMGHYITREQIERTDPAFVSDLLAQVPGVRLTSSGSGTRRAVSMARSVGRNCGVQIYMDGVLITKRLPTPTGSIVDGVVVDEVVAPNSVEGIEVYRGLSTVPAQFFTPDAGCGVIAIWTRRGDRNREPR